MADVDSECIPSSAPTHLRLTLSPGMRTTRRKKPSLSRAERERVWGLFSADVRAARDGAPGADPPLECVYQIEERIDACAVCGAELMVMDSGFPTCTNASCGVIYKISLDFSPEWRYYGESDKGSVNPARCGTPINPLLMESSFGCKVLCDGKSSYEMRKIRKWTEWMSIPHREKLLYEEFKFIGVMAQNAGISKIFVDRAMVIHKDISEQKMFRGVNRDGIKAASIYLSCRLNGCPRTAHEIADIFNIDKTSATTGCSTAVNILQNIERDMEPDQKSVLATTRPSAFVERFCSKFAIPSELVVLAKFVAHKVETQNIVSDNIPQAVSAGIIYLISESCNLGVTKGGLKAVCGVSEVTISKCFRKLDAFRDKLIPPVILSKYARGGALVKAT